MGCQTALPRYRCPVTASAICGAFGTTKLERKGIRSMKIVLYLLAVVLMIPIALSLLVLSVCVFVLTWVSELRHKPEVPDFEGSSAIQGQ